MGIFDDLRETNRTFREVRRTAREVGGVARGIDKARGEVQGAINGHYGDEEFYRSGNRSNQQESRYYNSRGRADDAREAYENRSERRDAPVPPQGSESRRPIPQDEFRHEEVAPPPSPNRTNPNSSLTAPKDDAVNPTTADVATTANPPVSSATAPAAEAASPQPKALSRDEAIALQTELSKLGLGEVLATSRTPSGIDGIVGDKTRKAFEMAKQRLGAPDLTLEQLANPEVAQQFKALVAQHLEASKANAVAQTPAAVNPPAVAADAPMQEAVRQALAGGLQPTITGGADTGGPQGTPMTPNAQPDTGRSVS